MNYLLYIILQQSYFVYFIRQFINRNIFIFKFQFLPIEVSKKI